MTNRAKDCQKIDEAATNRLKLAIRRHAEKHGMSNKALGREIGCSPGTIQNHLKTADMGRDCLYEYFKLFGADFINEALEPLGFAGVFKIKGNGTAIESLATHILEELIHVAKAAEDGVFDHTEEPTVRKAFLRIISVATDGLASLEKV